LPRSSSGQGRCWAWVGGIAETCNLKSSWCPTPSKPIRDGRTACQYTERHSGHGSKRSYGESSVRAPG
jgi:hypothetical protein